jgi:hypothetical protein
MASAPRALTRVINGDILRRCVRAEYNSALTHRLQVYLPVICRRVTTCATGTVAFSLVVVQRHLLRGLTHFELGTHFLDLGCVFFELCREGLYFSLLLRDGGLEFLL